MGIVTVTTAQWFALSAMLTIPALCYLIFKFIFWVADMGEDDED